MLRSSPESPACDLPSAEKDDQRSTDNRLSFSDPHRHAFIRAWSTSAARGSVLPLSPGAAPSAFPRATCFIFSSTPCAHFPHIFSPPSFPSPSRPPLCSPRLPSIDHVANLAAFRLSGDVQPDRHWFPRLLSTTYRRIGSSSFVSQPPTQLFPAPDMVEHFCVFLPGRTDR